MSVSTTYARAYFETASAKSSNGTLSAQLTQDCEQMEKFWNVLEQDSAIAKQLRTVLFGPMTSTREKSGVVEALAAKLGMNPAATKFLSLLARKGRLSVLPQILHALEGVGLEAEGGVLGQIISADPVESVSARDLEGLSKAFEVRLKKKVRFKVTSDPALLAGLKVTVGGVTYDGTLRAQLERVRETLTAN